MGKWLTEPHDLHELRYPEPVTRAIHTAQDRLPTTEPHLIALGIADLNPANILWDGRTCRLVDFEDAGLTDPAYELADHVEHIAARGIFDPDALVDAVGLSTGERARMRAYRPLFAAYWLVLLLPGNAAFNRNPPGTTEAQAAHLLALLDVENARPAPSPD
ncbi:MAG TPA: phosphotransferase [Pseudonocardiaceae bacterium]|nr:phosphotransferase [Pseudonocardiaceae bacterium]